MKGLEFYTKYMLENALDQIEYMRSMLQLNTLSSRLTKFIELSRQGMYTIEPLPKYSEYLLKLDYLESSSPKGAIRLKFNSYFASKIFPDLIPDK